MEIENKCPCNQDEVCWKCYNGKLYKYLIERKDTNEWYCWNFFGYYGFGYHGEPFGIHPDKKNDWTNDANQALQLDTRKRAEDFLGSTEFIHDLFNHECIITEHEFIDIKN